MFVVFLGGFAVYQNVIQINNHEFVQIWPKNLIHNTLEGCWSVSETKRHHQPLKQPLAHLERSFRHISLFNLDLPVTRAQIQTRETGCTSKLIQQVTSMGQRILVFNSDSI